MGWLRRTWFWMGVLVFASVSLRAQPPAALFIIVGDQHSAYGRTAQFVAHVERVRAENADVPVVVLINGDVFELGNAVAKRSAGAVDFAMIRALARRGPVVVNLGNHEPEFYDVAESVRRLRDAGAVVVGSLVSRETSEGFAPPGATLRLGETEVVVVGVATDLIAQYRAAVRPELDLTNPAVWAREKFPAWLARAPVRVVMSHAGVRYDREIFPMAPEGTLFAGAHDHLRFVHRMGRTVYVHSGAWQGFLSIAKLRRDETGEMTWDVEQVAIRDDDPADVEMAEVVRAAREKHLATEDLAAVGRTRAAMAREEAAKFVARAVRKAAGVDAVLIGNTTFGDGLPAGEVTREAFDACVRFDGTICVAEVSGAELKRLLARANQNVDTPFEERRGEFQFADGPAPAEIDAARTYRMATTDWGMKNRGRYFGREDLVFVERPELRLKAVVAEALKE
jgi:5''-nucleotidase/2'',3''-cyclic phosphodiesterase and related esterases